MTKAKGQNDVAGLLTPLAAAQFLAVSPRTLWGMARRGELPIVRIGRLTRYAIDDLRAYVERQTQQSTESA